MSTSNRVLGLFLLAAGLFLIVLGFANPEAVDEFNVYWIATVLALVPGILIMAKKPEAATFFARIVVGSVFIVSGLIKANDTVGFGIKLEEYFDENALGAFWAIFHDYALAIAIFVSGIEVLLGLALLFGAAARVVSFTLLGMTLFFGWLTYFTAECNDAQMAAISAGEAFDRVCVTDCGCFGDALRGSVGRSLTPWESFYKDLGLFFLTLVVVIRNSFIKVNTKKEDLIIFPFSILIVLVFGGWLFGWMFPTYFTVVSILIFYLLKAMKLKSSKLEFFLGMGLSVITYAFISYTYNHLPIKDYRPYAEGKNIKDQMKSATELGVTPTKYANVYKLENSETGETMAMNSDEYLKQEIWKDKSWKIVYTSPNPIVIERGYEPPIATFNVMDAEDYDIGEELLNDENYSFMVVLYDVGKAKTENLAKLNELALAAEGAGYDFYAMTSSPYEEYEELRHENSLAFPFHTGDEIFLKTIIRANPGILLMKNGEIIKKWHGNDTPSFEEVEGVYLK
ncbi:DoxX family membrane protein [Cryomorphaceae bacterium 1068]|nr:DoxX family membrane protein [Cryomorphaceae bacterium 1068]